MRLDYRPALGEKLKTLNNEGPLPTGKQEATLPRDLRGDPGHSGAPP